MQERSPHTFSHPHHWHHPRTLPCSQISSRQTNGCFFFRIPRSLEADVVRLPSFQLRDYETPIGRWFCIGCLYRLNQGGFFETIFVLNSRDFFWQKSLGTFCRWRESCAPCRRTKWRFWTVFERFSFSLFLLKNTSIQYDIFFLQTLPGRLRIFWTPKCTYLILNVSKGDRNNHHLCDFMSSLEALLPTPVLTLCMHTQV